MKQTPDHPLKIWRLAQRKPLNSQRGLGRRLKVSDMAVGRWEAGGMPLWDALIRIEALTGLTANDFQKHRAIVARRKQEEAKEHGNKT